MFLQPQDAYTLPTILSTPTWQGRDHGVPGEVQPTESLSLRYVKDFVHVGRWLCCIHRPEGPNVRDTAHAHEGEGQPILAQRTQRHDALADAQHIRIDRV